MIPRLIKQIAWLDVILLAASVGVLLYGCLYWRGLWADDAFISFRFARNLADGFGPVYNPGERIEGYTSPLWVFGMAGAIKSGIDPAWLARRVGVGSAIGLLVLLYRSLVQVGVLGWGAALTTFLLSSCILVHTWTMAGMETLLYSLILFGGLCGLAMPDTTPRTSFWTSLLLMLAVLTRPEAAVFWVGGITLVVLRKHRDAALSALAYLLPSVLAIGYLAWRYFYFGDLLPNTYYAKVGNDPGQLFAAGARELKSLFTMPGHVVWTGMALAGAMLGGWRCGQGRSVLVMAAAAAFYFAYVASVGGDSLGGFRFHVPMLAPMAFLAGLVFHAGASQPLNWLRAPAALAVVAAVIGVHSLMESDARPRVDDRYLEGNQKLGRYLAQERPADTLIAVTAGGVIPYLSGLPTLDLYGLTDRHIARQPFTELSASTGHMKWDSKYALARQPNIFVANRGYFRAGDPKADKVLDKPLSLTHDPMERDLFGYLLWNKDYELRPIQFADGSRFFVFERTVPRDPAADLLVELP